MHILLISPGWPLGFPNGIVTYVHHMRTGLRAAGHRVTVLTVDPGTENPNDEVFAIRPTLKRRVQARLGSLRRDGNSNPSTYARIIADSVLHVHQQSPVDVVEIEESFGWFAQLQKLLPLPVVVKLHGPAFLSIVEEERLTSRSQQRMNFEDEALKQARFVCSPTLDTLNRTRKRLGRGQDWGEVITNPIDLGSDLPLWSKDIADFNTLLFVGRFDKRKGGDLALLTFGALRQQFPQLRLIFVGPDVGVANENGQRLGFMEFVEAKLPADCRSAIEFLGHQPQAAIQKLRCRAAVTLICSRWDNLPNTALEAMLQGCPVAAIDSGGISEIIQTEKTGMLAAEGDLAAFQHHIATLLKDSQRAADLGRGARQSILQKNSVPGVAQLATDCYRRAIATFASFRR